MKAMRPGHNLKSRAGRIFLVLFCCHSVLWHAQPATNGSSEGAAQVNGAVFRRPDIAPDDVELKPFLEFRTGANRKRVSGFNTSARPVMNSVNPARTRDIALADVPIVRFGSTDYLQFVLDARDIGQEEPKVTLLGLSIFTRIEPFRDADFDGLSEQQKYERLAQTARLRWSSEGRPIEVNSRVNAYEKTGDLEVLIPFDAFREVRPSSRVYLYSTIARPPAPEADPEAPAEQWAVLTRPEHDPLNLVHPATTKPKNPDPPDVPHVPRFPEVPEEPVLVPDAGPTQSLLAFSMLLLLLLRFRCSEKTSA